jgi:radical SAM superfamily enzyme YgiQ (UPF0313 family)
MDSAYKRVMSPSVSLMIIAALTPEEHSVVIEDENVQRLHLHDSPDLVGITVNVDTSNRAYDIAAHYRRRGVPVILGGIHPSSCPEEAVKHADAVCIGEAETQWPRICTDAARGTLKRIYHSGTAPDMAYTPIPRWDLIHESRYLYTNIICATRGCPFTCEFCYNSCEYVHNKYRTRPIGSVIEEIRKLKTRHIMFIDDNLIGNIAWARDFFKAIKPLNLVWNGAVSTNIGRHPDLLDAMRDSGCKSLFIGFESINRESICDAEKHQNHTDSYEHLIRQVHNRGIMINASMVFGFDHDYPDVFPNTLHWLVRNRIETVTSHILTPYPGTRLFKRLERENRIIDYNWRNYNTANVVFRPKHMTPEELYHGYLWIYRNFYSFRNIYKRIPSTRSERISYLLFNLGYRKFGKITSRIARAGFMNALGRFARRLSYNIE